MDNILLSQSHHSQEIDPVFVCAIHVLSRSLTCTIIFIEETKNYRHDLQRAQTAFLQDNVCACDTTNAPQP